MPSILRSGHSKSFVRVTKANWEVLLWISLNQSLNFSLILVCIPCNHPLSKYAGLLGVRLDSVQKYWNYSLVQSFSYPESLPHLIHGLHICHINLRHMNCCLIDLPNIIHLINFLKIILDIVLRHCTGHNELNLQILKVFNSLSRVFSSWNFLVFVEHLIGRGGSLVLVVVWLDHFHPEIWQKNSQLGKTWK